MIAPRLPQYRVAPGTIELERAAVVRGRVLDKANAPLPIVTFTVLDHPELSQTLSRAGWRRGVTSTREMEVMVQKKLA